MVLDRIKKAAQAKEAEIKGEKWLKEVVDDHDRFQAYAAWEACYEPPEKPDSKQKAAMKKAVAEKAKSKIMMKVQEGLTEKLMMIILQVTSELLSKTEAQLNGTKGIPLILNSCNGIVLSYRFGKKNPRKFNHFRYVACKKLVETLDQGAAELSTIITQVTAAFNDKRDIAQEHISEQIDHMIVLANATLDDKAEEKLANARDELTNASVASKAVDSLGVDSDIARAKDIKDDIVATIGVMIKELMLRKLLPLTDMLVTMLEQIVQTYELAKTEGEALKEKVGDLVDEIYSGTHYAIHLQVRKACFVLEAMMDEKEDAEDS